MTLHYLSPFFVPQNKACASLEVWGRFYLKMVGAGKPLFLTSDPTHNGTVKILQGQVAELA
jgi:hypothetical protein